LWSNENGDFDCGTHDSAPQGADAEGGFHAPAIPSQAVDTTAAGDTYCGALAEALVEGKSMHEAVRFANAAAALCVRRAGAQPSIPLRAEIQALIETEGCRVPDPLAGSAPGASKRHLS
jgi:ribokinase